MKRRNIDSRAWVPGAFVSDTTFDPSCPAGINEEKGAFAAGSVEANAADSTATAIKRMIALSRMGK